MLDWINDYVGIPWADGGRTRAGCDCYGLVRLVLEEQFGVVLDAHDQFYAHTDTDRREIAALVEQQKDAWPWHAVDPPPVLGDVLLFTMGGLPIHCALALDARHMLHIRRGTDAAVESVKSPFWRSRLEGAYRYVRA